MRRWETPPNTWRRVAEITMLLWIPTLIILGGVLVLALVVGAR